MNQTQIIRATQYELMKSKKKFPLWPEDIIHAVSVMNEESGEAIQAALDFTYDNGSIDQVRSELIQTAAMAFRCLENIDQLEAKPCQM